MKRDFWLFAKYLKTEDQEKGKFYSFPIWHENYRGKVNADAKCFPHLEKLRSRVIGDHFVPILKSRRTYVSNFFCGLFLWESFFANKHAGESYLGGMSSEIELKSFDLLARVVSMLKALPEWLQTMNPIEMNNKGELSFAKGGKLMAFSSNPDIWRSFGFTRAFADEIAFHPDGRKEMAAITGAVGESGFVDAASTPNGKDNVFYDLCSGRYHPDLRPHKVHWSEVPGRDEAWKRRVMDQMRWTESDWAREMEFSFDVVTGPKMLEQFNYTLHARPTSFLGIQVGWDGIDFGYDRPAWSFTYKNRKDQWCWHSVKLGHRQDFRSFAQECIEYRKAIAPNCTWETHVPHDAVNEDGHGGEAYIKILRSLGVHPLINRRKRPDQGWAIIRQMLPMRLDGEPGIIINNTESALTWVESPGAAPELRNLLLEGAGGGFSRRSQKTPDGGTIYMDEPNRDAFYIHCFDSLNCIAQIKFRHLLAEKQYSEDEATYEFPQPRIR